jgi:hypothetical protein
MTVDHRDRDHQPHFVTYHDQDRFRQPLDDLWGEACYDDPDGVEAWDDVDELNEDEDEEEEDDWGDDGGDATPPAGRGRAPAVAEARPAAQLPPLHATARTR